MPRRSVAFTGVFELRTTPACTDSASPGLAPFPGAGPFESRQSPTRLVSGYSLRLSVFPNAAFPSHPTGCQSQRLPATYWIFRSALPSDKDSFSDIMSALITYTSVEPKVLHSTHTRARGIAARLGVHGTPEDLCPMVAAAVSDPDPPQPQQRPQEAQASKLPG
jgi:hypothetical protein